MNDGCWALTEIISCNRVKSTRSFFTEKNFLSKMIFSNIARRSSSESELVPDEFSRQKIYELNLNRSGNETDAPAS
jgi:hypothetical protein